MRRLLTFAVFLDQDLEEILLDQLDWTSSGSPPFHSGPAKWRALPGHSQQPLTASRLPLWLVPPLGYSHIAFESYHCSLLTYDPIRKPFWLVFEILSDI